MLMRFLRPGGRVEPFDRATVAPEARALREQLNADPETFTQAEVDDDLDLDEGRMLRLIRTDGSVVYVAADRVETVEPGMNGSVVRLASGRKVMTAFTARDTARRWTACRLYRPTPDSEQEA